MKQLLTGKCLTAALVIVVGVVLLQNVPTLEMSPVGISHNHRVEITSTPPIRVEAVKIVHDLKPSATDPIVVAPIHIDHSVKPSLRPGILFPPKKPTIRLFQAWSDLPSFGRVFFGEPNKKYAPLGYTKHNGRGNCSFTVIGPRASDGMFYAVFSRHCCSTEYTGFTVTVGKLKDHPVRIAARWHSADISLIQIDTEEELEYALVAPKPPKKGDQVWHRGHGVDKPDSLERGKILNPSTNWNGQSHTVYLSAGDSGSGLFRWDNNLLVGVNHSYYNGTYYSTSHDQIREFLQWCHPDRNMENLPYVEGGKWGGSQPDVAPQPGKPVPPKDKGK